MKKIITPLVLILSIIILKAQETENTLNAKIGLLGASLGYEQKLNEKFTLNAEYEYALGFFGGYYNDNKVSYVGSSCLSLEPRYYYNLEKRHEKGKETAHNAGNFIGLDFSYIPDWLTSSDADDVEIYKSFSIIPRYGIRRNLGKNINFESAFGIGYRWSEKDKYTNESNNGVAISLSIKVGYVF